jgi:RNA polymerase sigma-70 factor (ECF subfamily)
MSLAILHLSLGLRPQDDRRGEQPASEAAQILAAQNGDSAAFGPLIERYQGPLLRYLCRLVRRPDVGQDLCQETLLRAWRKLGDFDVQRPLGPWLYRIATNLALNFLQRTGWRYLPLPGRAGEVVLEPEPDIEDHAQSVEELLLRGEAIEAVQQALAELEPMHRAPLLLYYGEELSCRELADALDVTEAAAKVRLFRARARVKKWLEARGRT